MWTAPTGVSLRLLQCAATVESCRLDGCSDHAAVQRRCLNPLATFVRHEATEAKKDAPAAAPPQDEQAKKKKKKEKKPEKVIFSATLMSDFLLFLITC